MLVLNQKIENLSRVGESIARRLNKLGIFTILDLLYHFPSRYEDYSQILPISELQIGQPACIRGDVWEIKNIRTRNGKFLTLGKIADSSGTVDAVWFNQPYLTKNLKTGMKANFTGRLDKFNNKDVLVSPDYEVITPTKEQGETLHTGRLVPIYPETAGITSKWLRSRIDYLLKQNPEIEDFLPIFIIKSEKLLPLTEAISDVHLPSSVERLEQARLRLAFDELFILEARSHIYKKEWREMAQAAKLPVKQEILNKFLDSLPFELTTAQKRVIDEIKTDLAEPVAMNRLLEGDVGSGKTVVAAAAAFVAQINGYRTIFMAPTEILAIQHYNTLSAMLPDLQVRLVTRTSKPKDLESADIIVGTHALIAQKISFEKVGLVVIDEQHRFGVAQRSLLREKAKTPHILTMTATPIPRTLALTVYGDLELSVIDEMPKERLKILTYVVPKTKREGAYDFIRKHTKMGEQAFIICPLIEPSESLSTVRSAQAEYERLRAEIFPDLRLALLHGRLKSSEKEQILQDFKDKKYDILVSTPVVEVGIDIPNATVMMIEASDRFGLSGLHQLRGRVGRGSLQSYCLLFTDNPSPNVIDRLQLLSKYSSGIKLAEMDLKIRGAGEIFGTAQSGISGLRLADLADMQLIERTKNSLNKLLSEDSTLSSFPRLLEKIKIDQPISPN